MCCPYRQEALQSTGLPPMKSHVICGSLIIRTNCLIRKGEPAVNTTTATTIIVWKSYCTQGFFFIYKSVRVRMNVISLCSSGMLRSVDWSIGADVSGQPIGPMFNSQADAEEQNSHLHRGGRLKSCKPENTNIQNWFPLMFRSYGIWRLIVWQVPGG